MRQSRYAPTGRRNSGVAIKNWDSSRKGGVKIQLSNAPEGMTAEIQRIDEHHANPRRLWKEMGAPEYLSTSQLDKLHSASKLRREPLDFGYIKGRIELDVMLPAKQRGSNRI